MNSHRFRSRTLRPRTLAAAFLAGILLAVLVTSCGSSGTAGQRGNGLVHLDDLPGAAGVRGVALQQPLSKPDIRLTGTDGRPYDFRAATAGRLTLLFFGYTHCPDICPTTMADIAAALSTLPPADRAQVSVVFVTSDPQRDTPAALGSWLAQFDPSFVGLTGPFETIAGYAEQLGVTLERPQRQPDGSVTVSHGTQVTAFSPNGTARVAYLAGTKVADYAHDIPLLIAGRT
ncbi:MULTISPECIES: SCO family protein [Protofrankia]|uniref:Electron transporter SenC n=1 Tax=Protofrankia coriariae TaxID=1562887 RepID=A0ABR5EZD1_9ACTN|nr:MULTISPECIES: SCO family protein [Protofrankia]KLL09819.1 electron transporter SenC [Protofrankia coriariae]ONH35623.1 electron transporter SenC [Protofrankia sp. BMG5.30]